MAQKLPYSRVVDVTVTRKDRFATAQGFSVMLILGSQEKTGVLDAVIRTKLYSSMQEVANDFGATDELYKASLRVFQRNPSPKQIKLGYYDPDEDIQNEMDALLAYDSDWYWLVHTKELADTEKQRKLADWVETQNILFGGDTSAQETELLNNAADACFASYIKSKGYDRSTAFYHPEADAYLAASAFAYCARRNLDEANFERAIRGDIDSGQAYTLKFKNCPGIAAINKPSSAVQAITGFVPSLGLDPAQGNFANTYINIGGRDFIVEGNVASGEFIDIIHSLDWIRARIQEACLSTLLNNPRIPYTNTGVAVLINGGVRGPLDRALAAGVIAGDFDDTEGGNFLPEYEISAERVENVPESQRKQRVAPDIRVTARMAGAIHYASCNIVVSF